MTDKPPPLSNADRTALVIAANLLQTAGLEALSAMPRDDAPTQVFQGRALVDASKTIMSFVSERNPEFYPPELNQGERLNLGVMAAWKAGVEAARLLARRYEEGPQRDPCDPRWKAAIEAEWKRAGLPDIYLPRFHEAFVQEFPRSRLYELAFKQQHLEQVRRPIVVHFDAPQAGVPVVTPPTTKEPHR